MPAGDTELELHIRPADNWHLHVNPDGNLYIYLEEDDEEEPELALFKFFETGEAVDGVYIGTVGDGRAVKHLYWVNVYGGNRYDAARLLRSTEHVPEVSDARRSELGADAQGQGQDVQHHLPE